MSRTLIYAHRGANKEAAENTRTAFDAALGYAIDGMETDIQLSRDELGVLWHDDDLAKLGMSVKRIEDFDYAQLRSMNFASHFAGAAAEGVMSLREFITAYRVRCSLLLEIKRYPGEPEKRQQIKIRQTLALAGIPEGDRVLVSSFDLESLIYAHHIAPDFPLVLNLEPEHDAALAQRMLDQHPYLRGLCVHRTTLNTAMMRAVRECGKLIAVYTCNTDQDIRNVLKLGVDILISDVPQKALQMRDE